MSPGDHETSDRSLRAVGKLVSGHGELELDDLTTSDSATTPAEPHAQDPLQSQALSDHLSSPPSPHASTRIAAADDDDDDDEVQGQGTHSMSRAPLLRGSPATGTGSYGGLPYSLSTSAESSDTEAEEGTRTHKARRSRRKRHGKSGLRLQLTLTHSGDRYGDRYGDRDEAESSQSGEGSGTRARRSRNNESNSSRMSRATTLDNAAESVEGELESGLDSRFTADAGLHTAVAFEPAEDHLPSSASFTDTDSMSDVSDADLLSKRKDRREPADNSPYPQVRASVSPTDNITLSISTPRMWALSVLFAIFGSATNLFFSLRYPSVSITPVIALLLAHPLGWIWDRALKRASDPPNTFFNGHLVRYSAHHTREDSMTRSSEEFLSLSGPISDTGLSDSSVTWKRRWRLWLAQGTWNEKEHCCVYIASNVSFGFAFATDVRILPSSPSLLALTVSNRSSSSKLNSITKMPPSSTKSSSPSPPRFSATPLPVSHAATSSDQAA